MRKVFTRALGLKISVADGRWLVREGYRAEIGDWNCEKRYNFMRLLLLSFSVDLITNGSSSRSAVTENDVGEDPSIHLSYSMSAIS